MTTGEKWLFVFLLVVVLVFMLLVTFVGLDWYMRVGRIDEIFNPEIPVMTVWLLETAVTTALSMLIGIVIGLGAPRR